MTQLCVQYAVPMTHCWLWIRSRKILDVVNRGSSPPGVWEIGMLLNLHVKNMALIRELDIDFGKGLNILTGETGAGKSISDRLH